MLSLFFTEGILTITMSERAFRMNKEERAEKEISDRKKEEAVSSEEILEVFDHWVTVHKSASKRKPLLDARRRRMLAVAIYDYGVSNCKEAIDGCANSHFHMGQNKRGKVYNSLELIFRSPGNIERFMGYNE
jgi:hypothetical protein